MRRTLKLKFDAPDDLVRRLVLKHHYVVSSRIPAVAITLLKVTNNDNSSTYTVDRTGKLSPAEEYELERRCDRIVEWFPDPYKETKAVRTRLHNLRQYRKTVAEQQFILDYMDENFPEEGA